MKIFTNFLPIAQRIIKKAYLCGNILNVNRLERGKKGKNMSNTIEDIKRILIKSNFTEFQKALSDYNINEFDKFGNNILHYYLLHAKDFSLDFKDVINEVLNRGVNINTKQSTGPFQRSFLQQSVVFNLKDIFDFLIDKGADVNSTDANGNSMLFDAVMDYWKDKANYGYYIEKLLEYGTDPYKANNYGISAYYSATHVDNSDVGKYFEN